MYFLCIRPQIKTCLSVCLSVLQGSRRNFQGFKRRFCSFLGCLASRGQQLELLHYLLWYWAEKYERRYCVVLEWVPLRGEKHLKPRPQHRKSVSDGGFLLEFQTSTPVFSAWTFHSRLISHLIIWYLIPFQLTVNTSLVRELTLSPCFGQLQKIHFKAVTVPSLQISYTPRLAGCARGARIYFYIGQGFCFYDSVKFIRGELDLQRKVANFVRWACAVLEAFYVPLFVAGWGAPLVFPWACNVTMLFIITIRCHWMTYTASKQDAFHA